MTVFEKTSLAIFLLGTLIILFYFATFLFRSSKYQLNMPGTVNLPEVNKLMNQQQQNIDAHDASPTHIDKRRLEMQKTIDEITQNWSKELTDQMPDDGEAIQYFTEREDQWIYRFHFKSVFAEFNAVGVGASPEDAFAVAKQILQRQIREWHQARDLDKPYVGYTNTELLQNNAQGSAIKKPYRAPTVMIVEDDKDVAIAMESIFRQLGCKTIISDGHDEAAHKMSFQNVDFVVLDWMLGGNVYGDQIIQNSVRLIDTFKDLKKHFHENHAKVVTYSALDKGKVKLPQNEYFDHLDHWKKPVNYSELTTRAYELLVANGY